ncbi:MAG: NAD(P)H-hydrate dehydratase [Thermoleophilia bacterium]|nr:NAD(P)H-hydrate dehydratase [Thermoleophilia bacterium]
MPTEPLYTAAEMREAEATHEGPTLELMERAGAAVSDALLRRHPDAGRVSVWCGGGNNGGDGLVVARLLHAAGLQVEAALLAPEERYRGDAAESLGRAKEAGVPLVQEAGPADVVVDALFGTGFAGAPRREAAESIVTINASGNPVVSVDVPSGIDASTGEVAGAAVRASLTVTFHGRKVGLAVAPGRFHAGDVEVADIGLEHGSTLHHRAGASALSHVPRRAPWDSKYTAGAVLVVGGSTGLTGAPILAAAAALRAGAGVAFLCVPAGIYPVVASRTLEVMTHACPDDGEGNLTPEAAGVILELARRSRAVALGPGLGRSEGAAQLVRVLLERLDLPVVVDADGLFALAGHLDWVFSRDAPTVLTPHSGELGRLLGRSSAAVAARRLHSARAGADDAGATLLLKGADTIVAAPGQGVLVADLGNPGLATAGSGDVLTGVVAAFLARGVEQRGAAAAAAVAHGLAAGVAAERVGYAGLIASDVSDALPRVLS